MMLCDRNLRVIALLIVATFFQIKTAHATSWSASQEQISSPTFLSAQSVGVFHGTVKTIHYDFVPLANGGRYAYTVVRFDVKEWYTHVANATAEHTIYVSGGKSGDHQQAIAGSPIFHIGDDVIVFDGGMEHWLFGSTFGKHGVFRIINEDSMPIVLDNNGFAVTGIDNEHIKINESVRCESDIDRSRCTTWHSSYDLATVSFKEVESQLINAIDFENDIRDIAQKSLPRPESPITESEYIESLQFFLAR